MTETHGTDINETISVKGLDFSAQLTIGASRWLQRKTGKSLIKALNELQKALDPEDQDEIDIDKVAILLAALHISAHPGMDPAVAEAKVDTLKLPDMLEVAGRARPFEIEPKNSRTAPVENPTSTGRPSSTP